jgi:steroid delta-isomerase-like uncharacterized protein
MSNGIDIIKKWFNAMNDHNVEQMGVLCSENAIGDEVADPPPAEGRDGITKSYRELFEGFPDCKTEVQNMFSGGDQVLAEVRWRGTNTSAFRGTPATGNVVDIRIAYIFKVEGGKIRIITEYYDGGAVARQMGLA